MHNITVTSLKVSSASFTSKVLMPYKYNYSKVRFASGNVTPQDLGQYIEHTKLVYKENEIPDSSIKTLCKEAKDNKLYAVCVRPDMIKLAKTELKNSGVKVVTVIGFPVKKTTLAEQKAFTTIGDLPIDEKILEAKQAIADAANELDLVMNVRQFLLEENNPIATQNEFQAIKAIAGQKILKVILETDLLTSGQIKKATEVCVKAGVDIVKTSTGMVEGGKGATVDNISLINQELDRLGMVGKVGIKASGGVKTAEDAIKLIQAGATRLGTSNGVAIIQGFSGSTGY